MPFIKDERVEIRGIQAPNVAIQPGGAFEVDIYLYNHENFIINDPDGCSNADTPCQGVDGYCIEASANVVGGESANSVTDCLNLPFSGVPPNQEIWTLTLTAPQSEGEFSVEAMIKATASELESATVMDTIVVDESASDGIKEPGGRPEGSGPLDALMEILESIPMILLLLIVLIVVKEFSDILD